MTQATRQAAMDAIINSGYFFIYTDWTLIETQFDPERLHHKETVFTIGNGYLGTRGSFEEGYTRALPATLVHGVYNDVPVVYTELANCPDWLPLTVIVNGDRFRLDQGEILSYERQLDLRWGILSRRVRWRSPSGKTLDLNFERFASLADEHVLCLRCQLTPVDFDGSIKIQASINGYPENQGFNHWELLDQGEIAQGTWLQVRTRNSRIELGMASGLSLAGVEAALEFTGIPGYPTLETTFSAIAGQTVTLEKMVTVFTSRDVQAPAQAARDKLDQLPSYSVLLDAHKQAWEAVWQKVTLKLRVISPLNWLFDTTSSSCLSVPRVMMIGLASQLKRSPDLAIAVMYSGILKFLSCPSSFTLNRRSLAICLLIATIHCLGRGARRLITDIRGRCLLGKALIQVMR